MFDVTELFASQKPHISVGSGGVEVSGLSKDTAPENCKVRGSFRHRQQEYLRFYLVEIDDYLVLLRIRDAMPGSGYDEFAVVHGYTNELEEKQDLHELYTRWETYLKG